MSDTGNTETGAAPPPGEGPHMNIEAQYLKDLSFESPGAPGSLMASAEPPTINVSVDVGARQIGDDQYEINIQINAEASRGEDNVFLIEADYAGVFSLVNFPADMLEPLCLIECPRFLFPFARSIIADASRDGGFPPLMLEPIDFGALYENSRGEKSAGNGAGNGGGNGAGGNGGNNNDA